MGGREGAGLGITFLDARAGISAIGARSLAGAEDERLSSAHLRSAHLSAAHLSTPAPSAGCRLDQKALVKRVSRSDTSTSGSPTWRNIEATKLRAAVSAVAVFVVGTSQTRPVTASASPSRCAALTCTTNLCYHHISVLIQMLVPAYQLSALDHSRVIADQTFESRCSIMILGV